MSFADEYPIALGLTLLTLSNKYNLKLLQYQARLAKAQTLSERIAGWEEPFRVCADLTANLEVRGTPPPERCIFVSNHQNITMDNVMVNLALHPRYARPIIGENLAPKPWQRSLYEDFGCVIIGRERTTSALGQFRQIRDALKDYDVWVASTRGRSKNGTICADQNILNFYSRFGVPFAPVSISYEIEPTIERLTYTGKKDTWRDFKDILIGLRGQKGKVIVQFGEACDAENVQETLRRNYVVQESHVHGAQYFATGELPANPNPLIRRQVEKEFPREAFRFYQGIVQSCTQ